MGLSRIKYLCRLLVVVPLIASTAPNCVGTGKRDGAYVEGTTVTGVDFLTVCPAATSYVNHAETVLQSKCVTCHAQGGTGYATFPLIAGANLSNADMNTNYASSRKHIDMSANDTIDMSLILFNPLGNNGHDHIFTSAADTDYASVYGWISDERTTPCTAGN